MKREILFRGKTYESMRFDEPSKWVYGDYAFRDGITRIVIDIQHNEVVQRHTVGQYTGLHDKNDKEIYEDDIVQQFFGLPHYRNGVYYDCYSRIGTVVFESACFLLQTEDGGLYKLVGDGLTQEVIGNIHDDDFENLKSLQI